MTQHSPLREGAAEQVGVWVGLRKCGCCVAVTVDNPEHAKDVAKTKRDFLRDGLSVVYGTWDEWQTKYLPSMQRDCEHVAQAEGHSASGPVNTVPK